MMLQPDNLRAAGLCAVLAVLAMVAMAIADFLAKPRVYPSLNLVAIGLGTILVFALAAVGHDPTRMAQPIPVAISMD